MSWSPVLTPLSPKPFSGNIKRIVIFSSVVAIGTFRVNDMYTEEEWNDEIVEHVRTKGKESDGLAKYSASKTLAEKGAVTFIKPPRPARLPRVHVSCLGALQ